MKALSLWQPHAQAIALGLKPWETRDWPTQYRGPVAIQAAKRRWDDIGPWHDEARLRIRRAQLLAGSFTMPFGAVVCVANLVDCVRTSELRKMLPAQDLFWGDFTDGDRGLGRYAFKLANLRVLKEPFYVRGMQGWFDVELPGFEGVAASSGNLSLFGEAL